MDWLWRCSHFLTLCVLLLLQLTTLSNSLCSPNRTWSQYVVTPPPSTFGGQSTLTDCAMSGQCLGPLFGSGDRLGDGNTGPLTLDDGTFVDHAWNQTVSITFTLVPTDTAYVEGLNLYFYNIPSRRIGLPYNIRIISPSGDHPYQLEGNDDLTLDDNGQRSVTLIPESLSFTFASNTFTIIFEFSDTEQIDWLLLTEVEICTSVSVVLLPDPPPITFTPDTVGTISPPTINSSLSLSCSVTEGRFDWTWTRLTGDTLGLPLARVLNAGRTSVLELSQLSSSDAGTYQCLATHTFGGAFGTTLVSHSVDITLSLPGTLQAENGMIQVTASDDSAVLKCFLSGYFPSMADPSITWRLSNNDLSNDSVNTITSEQGDMFIQNGGAQPVPSLISTLTVNLTRDPLTTSTRIYNCISSSQMINPLVQTIVLTTDVVVSPIDPGVTTTPSPNPPLTPETSLGLIIGAILGVIILLMIIFVITLIIVIIVIKRTKKTLIVTEHKGNSEITTNSNEAYGFKPSTFSMTQNTLYGPGTTEEGVYKEPDQVQHDYEELDSFAVTSVSV